MIYRLSVKKVFPLVAFSLACLVAAVAIEMATIVRAFCWVGAAMAPLLVLSAIQTQVRVLDDRVELRRMREWTTFMAGTASVEVSQVQTSLLSQGEILKIVGDEGGTYALPLTRFDPTTSDEMVAQIRRVLEGPSTLPSDSGAEGA